jgi:UDP-glucose 4-epimerase
VLVTGGAGFIGSHVADALIARGDEVVVVDDLSGGNRVNLNTQAEFHQLDIRNPECRRLFVETKPDAVAHHAAQMSVSRSVREPAFDASVNIEGSLNLLEAAREVGARFVFASTGGALYGDADVLPTPESYPAWPVSPYGAGKLAFEHYLHCYRALHGVGYAALRYANVYGPRQDPHGEAGVVAIFCRALIAGNDAVINGDGEQTRDYVHVADVVQANLLALDSAESGHFNVGTGRQTSVNEIFRLIAGCLQPAAAEKHGPPRPGEQRTSALDAGLIGQKLGWRPAVAVEDGIPDTAAWFRREA